MTSSQFARKNAARLVLATALLALGVQPFASAQEEPTEAPTSSVTPASTTTSPAPAPGAATPSASQAPIKPEASPSPNLVDETPTAEPADSVGDDSGPVSTAKDPEPTPDPTPAKSAPEQSTPEISSPSVPARESSARLASPGCPPKDRSDSVTSITVAPVVVKPNELVTVNFDAVLRNGGCEGDFIDIKVPAQLAGVTGTYPITAPDGSVIAQMVVTPGLVRITFNAYLEINTNVSFRGNLKARVRNLVTPDTDYDLEWEAGNQVFVTPVSTPPCGVNCTNNPGRARKFATYEPGPPPFVQFFISSVAATTVGEVITFTDTVDAGHTIDCTAITVVSGTEIDAWGNVDFHPPNVPFILDSCTDTTMELHLEASAVGQFFRVRGESIVTLPIDPNQKEFTDSATVEQAGRTFNLDAAADFTDGGGEVDGTRRVPKVRIEKWSTVDGPKAGDFDDDYKSLNSGRNEKISFTIKNTGNELLNNIEVSDKTIAGKGTVRGLTCNFSPLGGPSKGTSWAGPFDIGDSFTCKGTLPALGKSAKHTDRARVVAFGRATSIRVTDTDDWNGKTQKDRNPPPGVDIEKWSTVDGPRAGDFDDGYKDLDVGVPEDLTFKITNRSKEPLIDIKVRDRVFVGSATVDSLTCDFSRFGGPSSGTKWNGPLPVGKSFQCTATLSALEAGDRHADRAFVEAIGENSGKTTTDTDEWHGGIDPPALPQVGLSSRIAPTAGIGILLALTGLWLMRRRTQEG